MLRCLLNPSFVKSFHSLYILDFSVLLKAEFDIFVSIIWFLNIGSPYSSSLNPSPEHPALPSITIHSTCSNSMKSQNDYWYALCYELEHVSVNFLKIHNENQH